jgi:hypothetical protein
MKSKTGPKPGTPSPKKGKTFREPSAGRSVTAPMSVWLAMAKQCAALGITTNAGVRQAMEKWIESQKNA